MTQSSRLRSGSITAPETGITVYEAIHNRRMNNEFTEAEPGRESLQRMLDAAVWAPNHRLTNPWRFFVLEKGGTKRAEVAQLAYDNLFAGSGNHDNADGSRQRVLDAPALIYVYSVPADTEDMTQENYAATCCAVQNLLLAAVAEGLAGEVGLTQVIPLTGSDIAAALGIEYEHADLARPELAIRFGVWYLARQLEGFSNEPVMALAAYNAGPGSAARWEADAVVAGVDGFLSALDFPSTRIYVQYVIESWAAYQALERHGQGQ